MSHTIFPTYGGYIIVGRPDEDSHTGWVYALLDGDDYQRKHFSPELGELKALAKQLANDGPTDGDSDADDDSGSAVVDPGFE